MISQEQIQRIVSMGREDLIEGLKAKYPMYWGQYLALTDGKACVEFLKATYDFKKSEVKAIKQLQIIFNLIKDEEQQDQIQQEFLEYMCKIEFIRIAVFIGEELCDKKIRLTEKFAERLLNISKYFLLKILEKISENGKCDVIYKILPNVMLKAIIDYDREYVKGFPPKILSEIYLPIEQGYGSWFYDALVERVGNDESYKSSYCANILQNGFLKFGYKKYFSNVDLFVKFADQEKLRKAANLYWYNHKPIIKKIWDRLDQETKNKYIKIQENDADQVYEESFKEYFKRKL
jgi:hypothetical protein